MADGGREAVVPARVAVLDGDDVVVGDRVRRREGERERLDGVPVQRPPDVDDAVPAPQQALGVVGAEVAAHAQDGRRGGLVDVGAGDGGAGGAGPGAAHGVVEEDDAVGAGDVAQEQGLDLGVVVLADGVVVGEVLLGRVWDALDDGEGVPVQVVLGLVATDVVDEGVDGHVGKVAHGEPLGWGVDVVKGGGAVGGWVEVVDLGRDRASRDGGCDSHWWS